MTFNELIISSQIELKNNNLDESVSFKILFFVFKDIKNINDFIKNKNNILSNKNKNKYFTILNKYIYKQFPLQYIFNNSTFLNYDFYISKNVHIPKYESEPLVLKANDIIHEKKYKNILDLCAGSGVIGISLKLLNNDINLTLSDIDRRAIKNIKLNLKKFNLQANIIKSNLLNKINDNFDLIICNPPYISRDDKLIDYSVKRFEPYKAIFAKENGLFFYDEIFSKIKDRMNKGSCIILEHGKNQLNEIMKLINKYFNNVRIENIIDQVGCFRGIVIYFA